MQWSGQWSGQLLKGLLLQALLVTAALSDTVVNPCCSFPCQNRGVCLTGTEPGSYTCDCANLEFYGRHCEIPFLWRRFLLWLRPSPDRLHDIVMSNAFVYVFKVIENIKWLENYAMKSVYLLRASVLDTPPLYETVHDYPTIGAHTNGTHYARTLPPVPEECPTPMGVAGPKELPDVDYLVKTFFTRTKFRPEPTGSSVLLAFFAQHFTHMFFKTDFKKGSAVSWSGHGVDVTSIYGYNLHHENLLRSFSKGKLRTQTINGETYPIKLKDAPIQMTYPDSVPEERRFALGHPFFGLLPGLFLFQTMWIREHNRVCDVLAREHPDWDDERLYQTSKLVILGETIKIVVEDYVVHLANYNLKLKFEPTVLFGEEFQYSNKINIEFNHLYRWHPLMPEDFVINGTTYPMKDYMFHSELVTEYGTAVVTDSMSRQRAGQMSHHNHGKSTQRVLRDTILQGRELRFQSLNNYRVRFNLPRYQSFEELTGETEMAAELQRLYGDIDAMEFYPGLLLEKRRARSLFGSTILEIGSPFSVKGLLANPICTRQYWRPSTFGGDVGFDIVKSATLEKLFCNNIPGPCPLVSFRVPEFKWGDVDDSKTYSFGAGKKDEL